MNTSDPRNRDRNLRIARRVTTGVVAAGVLGSLSLAGVTALSANSGQTQTGTTSASQSSTVQAPATGGGFEADEGGAQQAQPQQSQSQLPAPSLQPGLGTTAHGTTTGS